LKPHAPSLKASLERETLIAEENRELAREFLQARGLLHATASRFRLGVVPAQSTEYAGRLLIPSIAPEGNVYAVRYRSLDGSEPKMLQQPGIGTRLFNTRAIAEADDTICITEGEFDAMILEQCGFHAVGVVGANSWKGKKHYPRMFTGFTKVFILGDGDDAGQKFAKDVYESITGGTMVRLPQGQDVNDVFVQDGEAGIRKLLGEDDD
jgi:DNA primase